MIVKNVLIYTQLSFLDPLFYGTIYKYMCKLNTSGKYHYHIVSHEQIHYQISDEKQKKLNQAFKDYNISHYPLKWVNSKPRVLAKMFEVLAGFKKVNEIKKKVTVESVITLGSVAASYVYIFNIINCVPIIAYQFEPHSRFMVEGKTWSKYGLSYQLLSLFERRVLRKAKVVMTATESMKLEILKVNPKQNVMIVPTSVDESLFCINEISRAALRKELNLEGKTVFVYTGKFGDLYYKDEIAIAFSVLKQHFDNAFFLLLTPQIASTINEVMIKVGKLKETDFLIKKVPFEEMPNYLNASDFGIVAVPPTPSQKFRSPIKVGEYLMCGLPYLVCKGISDDDVWALKRRVGVVCDYFSEAQITQVIPQIAAFLNEDRKSRQDRCRQTGIDYRGINITLEAFKKIVVNG